MSMTMEMYAKIYSHFMKPLSDKTRWPEVGIAPIPPPIVTKKKGRPKTLRMRGQMNKLGQPK